MNHQKNDISNTSTIINQSKQLNSLIQYANKLSYLNKLFLKQLPNNYTKNCHLANFKAGKITLVTTNPIWKHQLRFILPQLKYKLLKIPEFASLEKIECKIVVLQPVAYDNPKIVHRASLSQNGQAIIKNAALTVSSPQLKAALLKLASSKVVVKQHYKSDEQI